jgi:hypothetical protein
MQAEDQDTERELAWQVPQKVGDAVSIMRKAAAEGNYHDLATALEALFVVAETHIGRVHIRAACGIDLTVQLLAASW